MDRQIFSSLNYYVVGTISPEVQTILEDSGAKKHSYISELVNVAITNSAENIEEITEISDIFDTPVVSCEWVITSRKCGVLLPYSAFPPKQVSQGVFKGKLFAASGLSKHDLDAVWAMLTYNGGLTRQMVSEQITHLIATDPGQPKCLQAQDIPSIKIVTPDWVVDCITNKKLVDEAPYHPNTLVTSSLRQFTPKKAPQQVFHKTHNTPASSAAMSANLSSPSLHQNSSMSSSGIISNMSGMSVHPLHYNPAPTFRPHLMSSNVVSASSSGFGAPIRPPISSFPPYMTTSAADPQPMHYGQQPAYPSPGPHHRFNSGLQYPAVSSQMQHHGMLDQHTYRMSPSLQGHPSHGYPPGPPQHAQRMAHPMPHSPMTHQQTVVRPLSSSVIGPPPSDQHHLHEVQAGVRPIQLGQGHRPPSKTPPLMNVGHMTEVPHPSQATMPEETPIIKMTNMAAFSLDAEEKKGKRASTSPQQSSRSNSISVIKPAKPSEKMTQKEKAPAKPSASPSVIQPPPGALNAGASGPASQISAGSSPSPATPLVAAAVTPGGLSDNTPHVYYGYDSNETVPQDMCLIGCIFYMGEYLKTDSDNCDLWIKAIEENGGTVDPSYSNRVTHVLVETQASDVCRLALNDHKRVVTAHWLNDVISKGKMEPPWRAHHLPHPHVTDKLPCADQVVSISGFDKNERRILRILVKMLGASFTTYLARSNTVLVAKCLKGEKVDKAQKWGIECVNALWISELVVGNLRALKLPLAEKYKVFSGTDDVFKIDSSLAATVMSGWRVPLKIPKDCWRKFKPTNKNNDVNAESKRKAEEEGLANPAKRFRLQEIQNTRSNLPSGQVPIVMLTRFSKADRDRYTEMLKNLGGCVTTDPSKCTHLVSQVIMRTQNFMRAMNYCSYVTSAEWIVESVKSNHFVDERVFTLQNSEAGSMWNILEALERRRLHGKPFANLHFHITPGVQSSVMLPRSFLYELITGAGGTVQPPGEKRWSAKRILDCQKQSRSNRTSYIVVTCEDDVHLCRDLFNNGIDCFSVEFILSGVMNQLAPYESTMCVTDIAEDSN